MKDIQQIIDRMKRAIDVKSDVDLANFLNLKGNGAVSLWKTRSKVPYKECDYIADKTGRSLDWLINGGEPQIEEQAKLQNVESNLVMVKEYDVHLSAGSGAYPSGHVLQLEERPFSVTWMRKKGLKPDNLSLVRVSGDSMEPLLKDKGIVMINHAIKTPSDAYPFAVRVEDSLYIKRVLKLGNKLILKSVNPTYSDMTIPIDECDCEIIGAIVWHAHSWV